MLRLRVFVVLALVVSLAGFGGVYAQQGIKLTGQDYAEIEQLYGRYNQGSDFRDVELWLSAFLMTQCLSSAETNIKARKPCGDFGPRASPEARAVPRDGIGSAVWS